MKGVVFTEFYDFVETHHSPLMLQEIINQANLKTDGSYTATGTYPSCEMGSLVMAASAKLGADVSDLLKLFGQHLLCHFARQYPQYFDEADNSFELLESVENHIHKDVRKLYPDAELPSFEMLENTPEYFEMIYQSARGLGDLCEGLIAGCMEYYGESGTIAQEKLSTDPVTRIRFTIRK